MQTEIKTRHGATKPSWFPGRGSGYDFVRVEASRERRYGVGVAGRDLSQYGHRVDGSIMAL
jgi:hypothetical protein